MNKEELFGQLVEKGFDKEEIETKFKECKEFFEGKNIKEENIEIHALARLRAMYKRQLTSGAQLFEGIIYGIDRATDFGASKLYDEAKKAYEEDPERAINEGLVTEEGEPIYSGNRAPKDGSIRKIDLKKDKGKQIYLVAKIENKDEDMKTARLMLRPNQEGEFDTDIPIYKKLVKFRANISQKSTDEMYVLNQSQLTEFEIIDNDEIDMVEFSKKYLSDMICRDLNELRSWHDERAEDPNRQVIIKCNLVTLRPLDNIESNIIEVDGPELSINAPNLTVWVPKDIPINFSDYADGLIIVGQTNLSLDRFSNEETVQINACSVWCPEYYRIDKSKEEEVREEKIKETIKEIPQEASKEIPKEDENKEPKQSFEGVKIDRKQDDDVQDILDEIEEEDV